MFLWAVIVFVAEITGAIGERLSFALEAILAIGAAKLQGFILSVAAQFVCFESRLELAGRFLFEHDALCALRARWFCELEGVR